MEKFDLSQISEAEIKLALYMQELSEGFYNNRGLQYLIDRLRTFLGRPLVLYDLSLKVLAASHDATGAFAMICSENGDKCIAEEEISTTNMDRISKEQNSETLSGEGKASPAETLYATVKIDIIEVARLAVKEAGIPFQGIDYMLVDKSCAILSAQLQRIIYLNLDHNQYPSNFLFDLIEGKMTDEATMQTKKTYLEWAKSNEFYIMIIRSSYREAFDGKISVIYKTLKSYIPVDQRLMYNSSIIAFIDVRLFRLLFEAPESTFNKFIEENNLYLGISRKFFSLAESKKQYQYAKDALEIGQKRNRHCSFFDDCILLLLTNVITEAYDPMDICHPAVPMLMKYDKEHEANLLNTLKHYIYYPTTPTEAARLLNIHRNTLFSRISKIKELTGIHLEYGDEKSWLFFSIRLLETKGIIAF